MEKLTDLPLNDLLMSIALREEDEANAKLSFNELYRRLSGGFYSICKQVSNGKLFLVPGLDHEIFYRVFELVYTDAREFVKKTKKVAPARQEAEVLAAMGQLGEAVMKEIMAEQNRYTSNIALMPSLDWEIDTTKIPEWQEGMEEYEEPFTMNDDELKQKLELLQLALETLKPVQRAVLIEYFQIKQGRKHLSDERLHYLCTCYNETPENIRQIKHRALKKVRDFFSNYEKNRETAGEDFQNGCSEVRTGT